MSSGGYPSDPRVVNPADLVQPPSGEFSFVTGIELGTSIAEVLGLDVTQISKMTIEMDAQGPAYVVVEAFVPAAAGREMAIEVQRYKLVQDGEAVLDG